MGSFNETDVSRALVFVEAKLHAKRPVPTNSTTPAGQWTRRPSEHTGRTNLDRDHHNARDNQSSHDHEPRTPPRMIQAYGMFRLVRPTTSLEPGPTRAIREDTSSRNPGVGGTEESTRRSREYESQGTCHSSHHKSTRVAQPAS